MRVDPQIREVYIVKGRPGLNGGCGEVWTMDGVGSWRVKQAQTYSNPVPVAQSRAAGRREPAGLPEAVVLEEPLRSLLLQQGYH